MLDPVRLLAGLAAERPAFHSEADFQHALAWAIREADPLAAIRLEYPPFPGRPVRTDIAILGPGARTFIEVKYRTRGLSAEVGGERFVLADQGAQPPARYDCVKDIARLEGMVAGTPGSAGHFVLLTNDSALWKPPFLPGGADVAFRLHEGVVLAGVLRWGPGGGAGTTKNREEALTVIGPHRLHWRDYSTLGTMTYATFRYLLVAVG